MKTAVIYKSRTGFTKKYALWISEALSAELFEASYVSAKMLEAYDTVIFGGNLHAVGIDGVKLITRNLLKLKGKRVIVFAVGLSVPDEKIRNEVLNNNFSLDERERIRFFYFRGGFDRSRLSLTDKILMALLKKKIENKKRKGLKLADDEKGMLAIYDKSVDYTSKKSIEPLVAYVKG
ncbi:MAG: Flavodoxin domain protein [Firmicutes bacterium ADurb.Bin182]|nr:MAG: Flavodoxin domain protein [Firmicutes bacterium ADurb.Bin182]